MKTSAGGNQKEKSTTCKYYSADGKMRNQSTRISLPSKEIPKTTTRKMPACLSSTPNEPDDIQAVPFGEKGASIIASPENGTVQFNRNRHRIALDGLQILFDAHGGYYTFFTIYGNLHLCPLDLFAVILTGITGHPPASLTPRPPPRGRRCRPASGYESPGVPCGGTRSPDAWQSRGWRC